jgi:PTS hybrid protein
MNLERVKELSDKSITIYDVLIVEGSYAAAATLQADATQEAVGA